MSDITLQNFEADLIHESSRQPVLLDIWAPWCGPCKQLGPVLEKLEIEYEGRFKLAKLNSDEQPEIAGQLSQMFNVRSIPLCVLFKDGQPVDGFVGALPPAQVRAFLDKHVPSADEEAAQDDIEEAHALLAEGDTDQALQKLLDAVAVDPANDTARYDALRALQGADRLDEARVVYQPVASQVLPDARFVAIGHWLAALERAPAARSETALGRSDRGRTGAISTLASSWRNATSPSNATPDAMDDLLEIVMRDKTWHDELARKTFVAILELMKKPAPPKSEAAAPAKGKLELAAQAVLAAERSDRRRLSAQAEHGPLLSVRSLGCRTRAVGSAPIRR